MKPARGAFRDFILGLPRDLPTDEVVARGKKAGLKFSPNTVRTTRRRAPTTRLKDLKARVRAGDDLSEPQTPVESEPEPEAEPTEMTGAAFVRSMPVDMPVAEVVAKGVEAGLNVTAGTVYAARSIVRRREAEGGPHTAYPVPSITRGLKGVGRGRPGSSPRREFIRSLPLNMPTDEVLARAEAAGLTITKQHVHQVRFEMRNGRREQGKQGVQKALGATRSAARVSRASGKSAGNGSPVDASREAKRQAFKALILELGMDDAQSIWEYFAYIRSGIRR
jgi:hypothetical protein